MFIEERHQKILAIVQEKRRVEVQDLSRLFNISEDSIRRDLRIMEKKGLLSRTYGGAVLPDQVGINSFFSERKVINPEVKEHIALMASTFIKDGDTILLDGSTTVFKLVPFLKKFKEITIITNSIAIAYEIINSMLSVNLILLGGQVDKKVSNTIGVETLKAIEELYVDIAFVAPCSISADHGITSTTIEEASIKKAMLRAGRQVFLLADSIKLGKRSLGYIGPIEPEYTLITDSEDICDIDRDFKKYIDTGFKIIYCS